MVSTNRDHLVVWGCGGGDVVWWCSDRPGIFSPGGSARYYFSVANVNYNVWTRYNAVSLPTVKYDGWTRTTATESSAVIEMVVATYRILRFLLPGQVERLSIRKQLESEFSVGGNLDSGKGVNAEALKNGVAAANVSALIRSLLFVINDRRSLCGGVISGADLAIASRWQ